MRQMLNKWLKDFLYEANSTPLLFTWTLSIILTEFVAQLSLIVTLTKRYKIWFDRLNIFPLGLPDGAILPEQEILVQLKEEIAKNCFRESLLEDSDKLSSLARTNKGFSHEGFFDD